MNSFSTVERIKAEIDAPLSAAPDPVVTDATDDARRNPAFDGHELVYHIEDAPSGLEAFIAIHDTTLGPALGGCRMWPYASDDDALTDALRLSRGMTFKSAMADCGCGGGKAVIVGDPHKDKSEALFRAFGAALERLGGRYVTGEDVGVSVRDVDWMKRETRYVVGGTAGGGGDPSPMTAYGVHVGIQVAVGHRLRRSSLAGLTVAVQGLGKVGHALCERLHRDGARLLVADIEPANVERARAEFGAEPVPIDAILAADADVLAPCALGGVLNDETVPAIGAVVVAGSANNQLLDDRHGDLLRDYGILYAPDYVINAGGLIAVAMEVAPGGYDRTRVERKTAQIGDTLAQIFARADAERIGTHTVADAIATERLRAAGPATEAE